MTTRHSSYKWNRLCAALERATEPKESYEEVKARLAQERIKDRWHMQEEKYDAKDDRPLPFDKMSDYAPREDEQA